MRADPSAVRAIIIKEITELLKESNISEPAVLQDDDVLLDSGLDSLGFTVLITRLEDALGYDPFTEMEDAVYPLTLGDFVEVYSAPAQASTG